MGTIGGRETAIGVGHGRFGGLGGGGGGGGGGEGPGQKWEDIRDMQDSMGRTALHYATHNDAFNADPSEQAQNQLRFLVRRLSSPRALATRDSKGSLPLHFAAQRARHSHILLPLLANPNNILAQDNEGKRNTNTQTKHKKHTTNSQHPTRTTARFLLVLYISCHVTRLLTVFSPSLIVSFLSLSGWVYPGFCGGILGG
jgi:hypothetical protein